MLNTSYVQVGQANFHAHLCWYKPKKYEVLETFNTSVFNTHPLPAKIPPNPKATKKKNK